MISGDSPNDNSSSSRPLTKSAIGPALSTGAQAEHLITIQSARSTLITLAAVFSGEECLTRGTVI